jgi:DNA-binding NarL/FixJ family response regulator
MNQPKNTQIRVLLVDDQSLFREGLRTLLSVQPAINVVGEAANGEEAIQQALNLRPDVILMDLRMPVMDGVAATRRLRALLPEARVIVLTTFDDDDSVFDGLRAGAAGYLLKDVSSARLVEAIQLAARGESLLQPSVAARVIAEFTRLANQAPPKADPLADPLSERELEILRQVANGDSNREIAEYFVIAEGTVKNHLTNILRKLNVQDRAQAVLKARQLGIL